MAPVRSQPMAAVEKRACAGTTVKGDPCGSPFVNDTGYCNAHDESSAISRLFVGRTEKVPGSGRPSKMDAWKAEVEAELAAWVEPYKRGRSDEDVEVAMRAADRVLDRVYGKATQRSEVTGADGAALPAWLLLVAPAVQDGSLLAPVIDAEATEIDSPAISPPSPTDGSDSTP